MKKYLTQLSLFCVIVAIFSTSQPCWSIPSEYFAIQVVDDTTRLGIPLVELRTVNEICHLTDSNGWVAFLEPGLMDQEVFFYVSSPGYEFPADGFGYHGKRLKVRPGQQATIAMKRINIAERLYRVTGQGIYRDTELLGHPTPIPHPQLNGQVVGQDSVQNVCYSGRLFWFWGDTSRPAYPLGQFSAAGATTPLTINPADGIDLSYFVDENGFSKKMFPLPGGGVVWIDGMITAPDDQGKRRMLCHFSHRESLSKELDSGFGVFNDTKDIFEPVYQQKEPSLPFDALGPAIPMQVNGRRYWYFTVPFPARVIVRVRDTLAEAANPDSYEVFVPEPFARTGATDRYQWTNWGDMTKKYAGRDSARQALQGFVKPFRLIDIETGKPITPHAGSVYWNRYRDKWVMIFNQIGGEPSILGEVWYAESDTPTGPWGYTRRIVTHDKYSFYNPKHHPYFDQNNGRKIYFEGTYSITFSGRQGPPTPRYDYNQVMYSLDLADPRLALPEAIYEITKPNGSAAYLNGRQVRKLKKFNEVTRVAFYLWPANRDTHSSREHLTALIQTDPTGPLALAPVNSQPPKTRFIGHAHTLEGDHPSLRQLFQVNTQSKAAVYRTDNDLNDTTTNIAPHPLCKVFAIPGDPLLFDWAPQQIDTE